MKKLILAVFFIAPTLYALDTVKDPVIQRNFEELELGIQQHQHIGTDLSRKPKSLVPAVDSAYDLGASGTEWKGVYADTITASHVGATTINIGGNGFTYVPWTSYTPTFSAGWGTVINSNVWYRIVGDELQMRGSFQLGTITAAPGTITLPPGYLIDEAKDSAVRKTLYGTLLRLSDQGTAVQIDAGGIMALCQYGTNVTTILTMTGKTSGGGFENTNVTVFFANNEFVAFTASFPWILQ